MPATRYDARDLALAKSEDYYHIGRAAELTGVTAKMIRHAEALGLIPKAARTAGDYRLYSGADLHTLRFIKRARGLGFSTREIANLLSLWRNQRRPSREVKRLTLQHVQVLEQKIEELRTMSAALSQLANLCHGDNRPECPILDDLGAPVAAGE